MPSNKNISSLPAAAAVQDSDLFVLEQGGEAKKLLGEHFKTYAQDVAERAVGEYVDEAVEAAGTATTKASEAAASAQTASTKASEAAGSASTASTKASQASTSATNAANSASTASTKATEAANSASTASTKASQASTSATNAANSASAASASATNAANSAQTAATKATDASGSATDAINAASQSVEASQAAESAASDALASKNSAQASASNAATAANSASIASGTAHDEAERAKGYADQAAATHDGVASFNARAGNVMPQEGDYTPEMLGLEPMSEVISEGPGGGPGKNKFRTAFDPQETTAVGNKVTKKGITAEIQYDGSIKLSGTSTGPVNFYFGYSSIHQEACDAITYSASILGDPQYISVSIQSGATGSPATGGRVPYTFINVGEYDGYYYFIVSINGSNRNINATVRLQKEYNAEATSWEPYPASVKIENAAEGLLFKEVTAELPIMQETNGYAKPWPGGAGKNYVPDGLITGASGTVADMVKKVTRYGVTVTVIDGKFNVNGSITTSGVSGTSIYGPSFTLPAGTYYWSRWAPPELSTTAQSKLRLQYGSSYKETNGSFTLSSDTSCRIEIFIRAGATFTDAECYCQIESGSTGTAFTPYENICPIIPHSAVDITVSSKNIYPITGFWSSSQSSETETITVGNITATIADNSKIKLNGTNGTGTGIKTNKITLQPGTYTFSRHGLPQVAQVYINKNGYMWGIANDQSRTIVISEADSYWFSIQTNTLSFSNDILELQIEEGSVATDWTPFKHDRYLTDICVNQWDEEWELGSLDNDGSTIASSTQIRSKNFIPVFPSAEYRIVWPSPNGVVFEYDADKNYITRTGVTGGNTLTTNASTRYLKFRTGDGVTAYGHNISINYPSRFTEYYPYTGNTVYGGEVDVTAGVLTCTKGVVVFDGSSDETWQRYLSTNNFFVNTIESLIKKTNNNTQWAVADSFNWRTGCWDSDQFGLFANHSNGKLYFNFNAKIAADLRTWLAAHPIQVVYELANPITIQLTPQQIKQLLGTNYLDAGAYKLSVTFRTKGLIPADDISDIEKAEKIVTATPEVLSEEEAFLVRTKIKARSNPNLLDNPFFTVNQRGVASGQTTNGIYCVDRWKMTYGNAMGTWSVNENGFVLKAAANTYATMFQYPQNIEYLNDKELTISVLFQSGELIKSTFTRAINTTQTLYSDGTFSLRWENENSVRIFVASGRRIAIRAIKLELGKESTLLGDPIPDYKEELLKCISSTADPNDAYANRPQGFAPNPNLLDNPWFTVNQRGITTFSTSTAQYTLDRWMASGTGSTITVNADKSVTIAKTAGTLVFTQRTELPKDYTKVYTLSVLLSNGQIFSKTGVFNAGTQGETAYQPTGMMSFYLGLWTQGGYLAPAIYLNANQTGNLTIKAMKLELGSVSTLANDAPPSYQQELAKCQRYFVRLSADTAYGMFGMGIVNNAGGTSAWVMFNLPVSMRRFPDTMTYGGSFRTLAGVNGALVTGTVSTMSISTNASNRNVARIDILGTGFGQFGTPFMLGANNDTSAHIDLSADL